MDTAAVLRDARLRAGLSQAQLAARAGTSQATISAYESATKEPSVATLSRLLAATGATLTVSSAAPAVAEASRAETARRARALLDVLALAAELPTKHEATLRFPRLPRAT